MSSKRKDNFVIHPIIDRKKQFPIKTTDTCHWHVFLLDTLYVFFDTDVQKIWQFYLFIFITFGIFTPGIFWKILHLVLAIFFYTLMVSWPYFSEVWKRSKYTGCDVTKNVFLGPFFSSKGMRGGGFFTRVKKCKF